MKNRRKHNWREALSMKTDLSFNSVVLYSPRSSQCDRSFQNPNLLSSARNTFLMICWSHSQWHMWCWKSVCFGKRLRLDVRCIYIISTLPENILKRCWSRAANVSDNGSEKKRPTEELRVKWWFKWGKWENCKWRAMVTLRQQMKCLHANTCLYLKQRRSEKM